MKTIQLNTEVLLNLYGGCEESKTQVFKEFLSGYSELKLKLCAAYESGSPDSMRTLFHHYGPSFLYLGVPEVAESFKKMEMLCKTIQDPHTLVVDFYKLLQMVDDTWLLVYNQTNYYKKTG